MRGRSSSLPHEHSQIPLVVSAGARSISLGIVQRERLHSLEEGCEAEEPFLRYSTAGQPHTSLGTHLERKPDSPFQMEERGSLEDIGNEVMMTLKGACLALLKFHLHDWLALLGLIVLDVVLNIITPFYRYVGTYTINDYMFPLKPNTIPIFAVPLIAVVIPLVIFIIYFLRTKNITDLHHALLGLFFSVLIAAVITDAIKDAVGRPRPDFYWRCFPQGNPRYDNITGEVECYGEHSVIKEGHKSFPSGHTSWSFAGLGFLSIYMAGKLQLFDHRGHVAKLVIVVTPLLGAALVGLSRIADYWHHWSDVLGGAIIGLTMAAVCYHHLYPSIFSSQGSGPHNHLNLGCDFKLAFMPRFPRRRPRSDWPPTENGDVELGETNDRHREPRGMNPYSS